MIETTKSTSNEQSSATVTKIRCSPFQECITNGGPIAQTVLPFLASEADFASLACCSRSFHAAYSIRMVNLYIENLINSLDRENDQTEISHLRDVQKRYKLTNKFHYLSQNDLGIIRFEIMYALYTLPTATLRQLPQDPIPLLDAPVIEPLCELLDKVDQTVESLTRQLHAFRDSGDLALLGITILQLIDKEITGPKPWYVRWRNGSKDDQIRKHWLRAALEEQNIETSFLLYKSRLFDLPCDRGNTKVKLLVSRLQYIIGFEEPRIDLEYIDQITAFILHHNENCAQSKIIRNSLCNYITDIYLEYDMDVRAAPLIPYRTSFSEEWLSLYLKHLGADKTLSILESSGIKSDLKRKLRYLCWKSFRKNHEYAKASKLLKELDAYTLVGCQIELGQSEEALQTLELIDFAGNSKEILQHVIHLIQTVDAERMQPLTLRLLPHLEQSESLRLYSALGDLESILHLIKIWGSDKSLLEPELAKVCCSFLENGREEDARTIACIMSNSSLKTQVYVDLGDFKRALSVADAADNPDTYSCYESNAIVIRGLLAEERLYAADDLIERLPDSFEKVDCLMQAGKPTEAKRVFEALDDTAEKIRALLFLRKPKCATELAQTFCDNMCGTAKSHALFEIVKYYVDNDLIPEAMQTLRTIPDRHIRFEALAYRRRIIPND